ncbi:cyclic nucleotide-binding domain-containing protein [Paenibacillus sp. LMG 31456]|uniref:Cyclic nucleotide-binding domain-containing protein n=1 Tax=Paenibacillus foliorum TaxID=2654974 RepID=A0A972GQR9_9BACL|nr:Crp/Fnr family transcriptional regulator [Paenibacillus foliorum]NOU94678.1 cyclic nucleotide-binding domain-containing protein [Paenibacillus foliorum]
MEDRWELLYTKLQTISPIPREEWIVFKRLAAYRTVSKGSHFVRTGEFTDSIGICVSGLFRLYYTTPEGNEFNKSFCTQHDFVVSYSSLLQNAPSFFSIQSLMDSELIVIGYRDFQSLYSRHVCWERLGRILIEQLFLNTILPPILGLLR